jgi:hypothetical protein
MRLCLKFELQCSPNLSFHISVSWNPLDLEASHYTSLGFGDGDGTSSVTKSPEKCENLARSCRLNWTNLVELNLFDT